MQIYLPMVTAVFKPCGPKYQRANQKQSFSSEAWHRRTTARSGCKISENETASRPGRPLLSDVEEHLLLTHTTTHCLESETSFTMPGSPHKLCDVVFMSDTLKSAHKGHCKLVCSLEWLRSPLTCGSALLNFEVIDPALLQIVRAAQIPLQGMP